MFWLKYHWSRCFDIVASLGMVALVIGFGAESLIEDVITGLFMIAENQYNVNDIVEVNGLRVLS